MSFIHFAIFLTATILIPLGIGLYHYRSIAADVRVFLYLIIVGTVNESIMITLSWMGYRNLFTLHIWMVLELTLLSLFFYRTIQSREWRMYARYGAIVIISLAFLYAFYGENIHGFNSLPRAVQSLFIISLSGWLFYERYVTRIGSDPARDGVFFINGGILFYFSASFIVFTFSKYVIDSSYLMTFIKAHSFVNAFCNLIFAYGIWTSSRLYSTAL
jgi:hypothetical protein